jgi:hypothetical protein
MAIMGIAALAFDAGMMLLERRDQQNAADAAALAGARYLIETAADPEPDPEAIAREIATVNGFTDAGSQTVTVNIPPTSGDYKGFDGFIEVIIENERPTIFGSVLGFGPWDVSSRAVAANQQGLELPFSMLTLHETECKALQVSGTGVVNSAGSVQVNSSCGANGLDVGGSGVLTVTADGAICNAVGGIDEHGTNAELNCTQVENSYAIKDPLRNLATPPVPAYPAAVEKVPKVPSMPPGARPKGCPGAAQPATSSDPDRCSFNTADVTWRIFPGFYPGGIEVKKGTVYMEPGIYYIGGGGFKVNGGTVWSVDAGGTVLADGTGFAGGVMIFNTEAPEFHDECEAGTAPAFACLDSIQLNGSMAPVNLKPLNDGSLWDGLVIYQDRALAFAGDDLTINGADSPMEVAGTIYLPTGDVKVNGSTSVLTLDQVIASTYKINGSGGTIEILYRSGVTAEISGVGLVE